MTISLALTMDYISPILGNIYVSLERNKRGKVRNNSNSNKLVCYICDL